jgi:drug/metabolite transporter (DMT)-like permease
VAPQQLVRVVLWMGGALLAFSVLAVSVRVLAPTLTVMEILAVRAGLGLMVMVILAAMRPDLRSGIRRRHLGLHLIRNTIHLGGQWLWAMSILLLPLATVFSLEFTAPAWTLLLAVPLLGERITATRVGAVALGLAGVLVILRPGLETFQPAALLVLAAAFGFAMTLTLTKKLTRTETTFAIILFMNLIQFPLALSVSNPWSLTTLSIGQIPALAGVGLTGLVSHYCLANAFRSGEATIVVPLDFMRIPLIAVIGWWLYGERLDVLVFAGAGLIVAGIFWNLRAEAVRTALAAAGAVKATVVKPPNSAR